MKTGQVEPSDYAYLSRLIGSEPDIKSRRAMIESLNRVVSLETIKNLTQQSQLEALEVLRYHRDRGNLVQ